MCLLCEDKFSECRRTRGSVDAKWTCPLCGEVTFTKGEDPPAAPANWGAVASDAVFYVALAVVLVAVVTGFKF